MTSYHTIQNDSEGIYKEKGSKFHSFALRASTEDEVKIHLDYYRKKYFDARHHCYAYILGPEPERHRANDDGEPHHSAGDPILGQIQSRSLLNVLVIVIRYFGGTKLGIGGLVTAYKSAATDALDKCKVIEVTITKMVSFNYQYDQTNEVMKLISDFDIKITSEQYGADCKLEGAIPRSSVTTFEKKAKLITSLNYQISDGTKIS